MKSNYPRKALGNRPTGKPKIVKYTIGLTIISLATLGLFADRVEVISAFENLIPASRGSLQFVLWMAAVALGIVLAWNCSWWKVKDKAKLLLATGVVTSICAFTVNQIYDPPYRSIFDETSQLFIVAEYAWDVATRSLISVLILALVGNPIWLLARGVRKWMGAPMDEEELLKLTYGEDALNFGLQHRQVKPQTNSAQKA